MVNKKTFLCGGGGELAQVLARWQLPCSHCCAAGGGGKLTPVRASRYGGLSARVFDFVFASLGSAVAEERFDGHVGRSLRVGSG